MAEEHEVELLGWDRFFNELKSLLVFCDRRREGADRQLAVYIVERLQLAAENVATVGNILRGAEDQHDTLREHALFMDTILQGVHQVIMYWEFHMETLDYQMEKIAYHAPQFLTGLRGRPKFHVTSDQLLYLRTLSFSWTSIASLLGVSRMTIYRRRRVYGLLMEPNTIPDDAELSQIIRRICSEAPNLGQMLVHGRIRSMGYHVTRERVRTMMRRQDPLNTALRMPGGLTARRKYSVPGPNSLWHIGMWQYTSVHTQKIVPLRV